LFAQGEINMFDLLFFAAAAAAPIPLVTARGQIDVDCRPIIILMSNSSVSSDGSIAKSRSKSRTPSRRPTPRPCLTLASA
jgi:hypothetical protein